MCCFHTGKVTVKQPISQSQFLLSLHGTAEPKHVVAVGINPAYNRHTKNIKSLKKATTTCHFSKVVVYLFYSFLFNSRSTKQNTDLFVTCREFVWKLSDCSLSHLKVTLIWSPLPKLLKADWLRVALENLCFHVKRTGGTDTSPLSTVSFNGVH